MNANRLTIRSAAFLLLALLAWFLLSRHVPGPGPSPPNGDDPATGQLARLRNRVEFLDMQVQARGSFPVQASLPVWLVCSCCWS